MIFNVWQQSGVMKNKAIKEMITKKDAEKLAKKYDKDGIIIFHFEFGRIEGKHSTASQFGFVSYGKNKKLCDLMQKIADKLFEKVFQY